MNIGIIGFGKMGMLHGGLLNSMDDVNVVAVTDTSRFVLSAFKSVMPNMKYFTTYKKMIDTCELDAVIIATPSFSHCEIAKYALSKNINVFIEKPLASSASQAKELYDAVKNTDLISMTGFCMRYAPTYIQGKKIIDDGVIGEISEVKAGIYVSDVLEEHKGWRYDKKISGGGVLIDFTIHMVDLLNYYFGRIDTVKVNTTKIYSKDVEDEVSAEITFESGIKSQLDSSWSNPNYRKSYYKIEIAGSKANMTVTDQEVIIKYKDDTVEKYTNPDLYEGYYLDIGGPLFSVEMESFINAVRNKAKIETDIEHGYYIQSVIDKMYESAEKKISIKIEGDNSND